MRAIPAPARRSRSPLLLHIRRLWVQRWRSEGPADALRGLVATLRALGHVEALNRLFALDLFCRHIAQHPQADPLFAVSHQHFLSQALSLAERIECAESHFRFESAHCDADYQAVVYADRGLPLWQADAGGVHYSIVLRHSGDLQQEGPASVSLLAGATVLHVTSFAWVPAQVLAPAAARRDWLLFITRNQSAHVDNPAMATFGTAFPHNAPSYFCMAAVLGIAEAHRQPSIAGIADRCQIAYEPAYAAGFRRSYGDFWHSFGGVEASTQAHLMPVPAQLAPLSAVAAKHRARARSRPPALGGHHPQQRRDAAAAPAAAVAARAAAGGTWTRPAPARPAAADLAAGLAAFAAELRARQRALTPRAARPG